MFNNTYTKWIVWGLISGLVGTVIMDLIIVAFFLAMGMPADLIYSFIGTVAQSFLMKIGISVSGVMLLGASIHFLLGLVLGGLFGLIVTQVKSLRVDSFKKGILLGILYIEIVSQPILVTAPLLIKMTSVDILQWYGLSTAMHMIYGAILGGILSYQYKKNAFEKNTA
ncbi:hypothetical protein ANAEL_00411 [Anaerolineales bacterium]|nr:hypothetical protein ANAEL_00411 [Anaerolineales bacterium]